MEAQAYSSISGIITRDPALVKVCRNIEKVAPSDATVIVLGESGTGKEILARTLHQSSPRREKRFMAINCAAIPEALLERDVVDFNHLPLAENYSKNRGLSCKHTLEVLEVFLKSPKFAGLTLTEINPDHGAEDGSTIQSFAQDLSRLLALPRKPERRG